MKRFLILSLAVGFGWNLQAQVTERERPAEWKNLVEGARFMDRLQPMKGEILSSDVWGADSVRPRLVDNGIELPETSFWGGNILQTSDGKYHLFVCGWPENSPEGHMFWRNSTVFHAVGDKLEGPYAISDTIRTQPEDCRRAVQPDVRPQGGRFLSDGVSWRRCLGQS